MRLCIMLSVIIVRLVIAIVIRLTAAVRATIVCVVIYIVALVIIRAHYMSRDSMLIVGSVSGDHRAVYIYLIAMDLGAAGCIAVGYMYGLDIMAYDMAYFIGPWSGVEYTAIVGMLIMDSLQVSFEFYSVMIYYMV